MSEISMDRKKLAQLSDKELDDLLAGNERYLLRAFRERTYRTDKKLIKLTKTLTYLTTVLCVLTLALIFKDVTAQNKHPQFHNQSGNEQTTIDNMTIITNREYVHAIPPFTIPNKSGRVDGDPLFEIVGFDF